MQSIKRIAPATPRRLAATSLALILTAAVGCSTSLQITGRPVQQPAPSHRSVYLVSHAEESRGVEASIQKNLFQRGYVVSAGAEGGARKDVDLIVRYTESWSWDLAFYLKSTSILVYDARSAALVGSGDWKNSGLHSWPNVDGVVGSVIDGILSRLGLPLRLV